MIHQLSIHQLAQSPGIICLEEDFALCDKLSLLPHIEASFHTDLLMVFFCLKGHMQAIFGDQTQQLSAGDAYLCRPRLTIQQVMTSSDCQVWVLFYTPRIVDYMLPARHDVSKVLEGGLNPIVHFGADTMNQRFLLLLDMLRQRATHPHLPFRTQSVYHLFATLLFEVLNPCCIPMSKHSNDTEAEASETLATTQAKRADTLFKLFIKHLSADNGCHRTVAYYADLLCVSPKHLSRVIRQKTGTPALTLINKHAIQQIKLDLKLTDLPINELATKYNFSNFSFFCQFVKSNLGMTPQEYRET